LVNTLSTVPVTLSNWFNNLLFVPALSELKAVFSSSTVALMVPAAGSGFSAGTATGSGAGIASAIGSVFVTSFGAVTGSLSATALTSGSGGGAGFFFTTPALTAAAGLAEDNVSGSGFGFAAGAGGGAGFTSTLATAAVSGSSSGTDLGWSDLSSSSCRYVLGIFLKGPDKRGCPHHSQAQSSVLCVSRPQLGHLGI
jgi:hypothetical protein